MPRAILKTCLLVATMTLCGFKFAAAEDVPTYREIKAEPAAKVASLFITPVKDRDSGHLIVDVVIDPNGEEVNALETEITYDSGKLKLIEVSQEGSFCQFFIEEDVSIEGRAKLSCLAPFPGIDEIRKAYSLTFEQLTEGETEIGLSPESMILANDGYGTNIAREIRGQKIILEQ